MINTNSFWSGIERLSRKYKITLSTEYGLQGITKEFIEDFKHEISRCGLPVYDEWYEELFKFYAIDLIYAMREQYKSKYEYIPPKSPYKKLIDYEVNEELKNKNIIQNLFMQYVNFNKNNT